MPAAMAQIAEKGAAVGARYVCTFVGDDNIASLKGCEKAGFSPYLTRTITTRLFNLSKRIVFTDSTNGYLLPDRARRHAMSHRSGTTPESKLEGTDPRGSWGS